MEYVSFLSDLHDLNVCIRAINFLFGESCPDGWFVDLATMDANPLFFSSGCWFVRKTHGRLHAKFVSFV